MMWGPGPWASGFWWIIPLVGLMVSVGFMGLVMRAVCGSRNAARARAAETRRTAEKTRAAMDRGEREQERKRLGA
jgi:hypothetical protein